ncbi:hypothetical protein CLU79DRAFT_890430, partial [Phycomyces nitens]
MHFTNSTTCMDICSKGLSVGGQTYFPCPGIAPGAKMLRLFLTQLPFRPRLELEQTIKTALAAYGSVREVGMHFRSGYFDGTGYAYLEQPPNPDTNLAKLSFKIPYEDDRYFLGTWKQMGLHCNYCKAMGHDIDNCPERPNDSRRCFTCDQTGHLRRACPRALAGYSSK